MHLLRWLFILVVGAGFAALVYVIVDGRFNDADNFTLVRERTNREGNYRLHNPLPGEVPHALPLEKRLAEAGFKLGQPIFIRIFKLSFELEVWIKKDSGYALFATYPICDFSGRLGPKMRSGDNQTPEGFYRISSSQLNRFSSHHRALNLGFPNAYDMAHGRTGFLLEVHGGCTSIGCYAITDPAIDDVYKLAQAALEAGQPGFQVQALPFRMTPAAMQSHAKHPQAAFWEELKTVADVFDQTGAPPDVAVCDGHYRSQRSPVSASPGGAVAATTACQKI